MAADPPKRKRRPGGGRKKSPGPTKSKPKYFSLDEESILKLKVVVQFAEEETEADLLRSAVAEEIKAFELEHGTIVVDHDSKIEGPKRRNKHFLMYPDMAFKLKYMAQFGIISSEADIIRMGLKKRIVKHEAANGTIKVQKPKK